MASASDVHGACRTCTRDEVLESAELTPIRAEAKETGGDNILARQAMVTTSCRPVRL
jgi:hypothetical protein